MIQNEVLAAMQAKRQQLEAQRLELEAKLKALEDESKATDHGTSIAQEALATLEQLILDTPTEVKPALFKSLFKALEQEAKRSGIKLAAEVVVGEQNGNGKAASTTGKRTRKTMDDISEPSEFAVFPTNKRLGIDGFIDFDFVRYRKVYIGVDGLRTTAACEASATVWRDWLRNNNYSADIKTGMLFYKASQSGLEGNYLLELNDVILADLSRLVDLDFSQSPESEHNEALMNKDYRELKLLSDDEQPADESTEQPQESDQPEVEQVEEIRETEPVEVQLQEITDYYLPGVAFTLQGVDGYEGIRGNIVEVTPGILKPYECDLRPIFPQPLMLAHEQIQIIPEDDEDDEVPNFDRRGYDMEDEQTEDEEDLSIPF